MSEGNLVLEIVKKIRDTTDRTASDVAVLTSDMAKLQNTVDVMNARLEVVETTVHVVNARLEVVETTVHEAAQQIVFASRKINNVERRHDRALDELRERVVRLEADRDKAR